MVARIGSRTWICDCCGLENDQRGCVKGPPTCDCYHSAERVGGISFFPDFCSTCGRCRLHCPGSPSYEVPDDHPFARYRRGGSEYPINKTPKSHPFRTFGFCHCEEVKPEDLINETHYIKPDEHQPGGPVHKVIHTVCAKWYMPVETAEGFNDPTNS